MTADEEAGSVSLEVSRIVPAPPEAVFRAWTEPREIEKWWAPDGMSVPFVDIDLKVGGTYRLGLQRPDADPFYATGTYREVQPPRRLVFTWRWEPDTMKTGETLVTIEFHEQDGKTEIVLTHERFPSTEVRDEHRKGWTECLERLGGSIIAFHDPKPQRGGTR
ncbi:MAG TPA: SRPBCC domain-containing protein [Gemmatimonadota bacterium]|nr:SRPBCC domain-containing protein [Gemmatimonadota bacterium]